MTRDLILDQVAAANPVATGELGDTSRAPAGERLLRRIVAMPTGLQSERGRPPAGSASVLARPGRSLWRPTRRRLLAVGASALAVTGAGFIADVGGIGDGRRRTAYAGTPPLLEMNPSGASAAGFLNELARRVAARPDPSGAGRYCYSRTERWLLTAVLDAPAGTTTGVVIPERREVWVAPDGTGRVDRRFGTPAPQTSVHNAPSPATVLAPVAPRPAGVADPLRNLSSAPTDLRTLARWLDALPQDGKTADSSGSVWVRRLRHMQAIWAEQPVPSRLQATFLGVLASVPDLVDQGDVTDRAGRRGRAVSFDVGDGDARVRHLVIVAPETGAALGYEQILLTERGRERWSPLPVRIPAVVDYVAYLAVARVSSVGMRP